MRVRIWLTSPVLLWSSQFLYQVSTSVLQEGLYQIHLIKQSYYEAFNSKLNMYRDLNAELYWQCYTITQLQSLYRTRVCISWSFDNKLLYQMSESALLVERWTIRYLAEPPPLSTHPTLSSLLAYGSTIVFSRQILDSAVFLFLSLTPSSGWRLDSPPPSNQLSLVWLLATPSTNSARICWSATPKSPLTNSARVCWDTARLSLHQLSQDLLSRSYCVSADSAESNST